MGKKSGHIKWFIKWIIPLTVLAMTLWIYLQYEQIEQRELREPYSTREREHLFDELNRVKFILYQDLLKDIKTDYRLLDYVEITRTLTENDYLYWDHARSINNPPFNELSEAQRQELTEIYVQEQIQYEVQMVRSLGNLQHFAIYRESDAGLLHGDPSLEELSQGRINAELFKSLTALYRQVVVYEFNEFGEGTLSFILDSQNKNVLEQMILDHNSINFEQLDAFDSLWELNLNHYQYSSYYEWLPIENTTFVFGILNDLAHSDEILWQRNQLATLQMENDLIIYLIFSASIVALVTLLVPVQVACQGKLMNLLLQVPIEIIPIYMIIMFFVTLSIIMNLISVGTHTKIFTWQPLITVDNFEIVYVHLINIGAWICLLGSIAYFILYVKHLFKQGFKGTLRNNSLIIGSFLKFYDFFIIDLKKPLTKAIFGFILCQWILVCFIFLPQAVASYRPTWFFLGTIVMGIYSLLLFFFLSRKADAIREKYLRLFEVTNEMSNGNLDIQIDEDLGIFNSIKNQLAQIKNGFKKAVENETTSQRMKTDLIANVSHDLKTPLTSIITYIDLLKDDNLELEKRNLYLVTLEQKSNRLKVLIEDLFEMSKVSSGDIKLERQNIDVVALMKQTLMELEDKIDEAQLIIRPNFPKHKVKLLLDGQRTYRVFENLILNMVKYALPKTRAYIDIIESDEQVTIMLRNISASEIMINTHELTERFVRGDQSRHSDGWGLGLAIAKNIVELQDGVFTVQVDGDLFKVTMTYQNTPSKA